MHVHMGNAWSEKARTAVPATCPHVYNMLNPGTCLWIVPGVLVETHCRVCLMVAPGPIPFVANASATDVTRVMWVTVSAERGIVLREAQDVP